MHVCFCITARVLNKPYLVGTTDNPYIQGDYKPFSSTYCANSDGLYEFDVHCIAMINNACFDLLLQAKYPLVNDGVDLYSSLSLAMNDDKLDDFKLLLPFLLDINEQSPITGCTLLHLALSEEKFEFALELLKSGAQDNILDNCKTTALDLLNNKLYEPSVSLETLSKAREYQDFKIELLIKKQLEIQRQAVITIMSFWRKGYNTNTSNASLTQELRTEPIFMGV